jgi:hypothetical protein
MPVAASTLPVYKQGQPLQWKRSAAITKSDVTVYDPPLDGFLVTVAGDVTVHMIGDGAGTYRTFPVLANVQYAMCVDKVRSTGTTATGIIGGYY